MVSNAREDFPEPLTPVTTVMALCGISTLIFFRLWTRAPRTQMDSCAVRTSMGAWVISLVAKGKPRQRVSSALPKLQIILPMSKRGKRRIGVGERGCKLVPQIYCSTFSVILPIQHSSFMLIVAGDCIYTSTV